MYCHNFFVSEELFSSAQAEGFTVQLLTDEGERGVAFGLISASVKVVDGECVYFSSGPLMHFVNGIPLQCLLCRNLQWSRHHTQWHSKHVVFTMQKHFAWFTKILTYFWLFPHILTSNDEMCTIYMYQHDCTHGYMQFDP